MTHIDDWMDHYDTDVHASWFFWLHRLPATMQCKFEEHIKEVKLFCDFECARYRVSGCSRLGDVWLAKDFKRDHGYDKRVAVDDCSDWGKDHGQDT